LDGSFENVEAFQSRVLVVDDDPTSLFLIEQQLLDLGYKPDCVGSAVEALDIMDAEPNSYGAIIIDRMMDGMDGLQAATELNMRNLSYHTQIIMLSGADSQEEIQQGIEVGIFYYLTKPAKIGLLKSVLAAAIKQSAQNRASQSLGLSLVSGALIEAAHFKYRTLEEAASLSGLLASAFPDPQRVAVGVAALLNNAVEHGLARLGFEEKGALLRSGDLRAEINRRLEAPDLSVLKVDAKISRKPDGMYLVITDPGPGFDWRNFITPDQSRAATTHGRGIVQAKMRSFDKLVYNEAGNQVVAFAAQRPNIDW
jgi:CheY-like chemotaxis protein